MAVPLILVSLAPVSMSEFPLSVQQRCRSRLEDLKEMSAGLSFSSVDE